MARMLESAEAARRLGVKVPTLYAYVSRGLLVSHPAPGRRRSLFAADEVEALAKRSRGGRVSETRLATVTTATTQLRDDGPAYRGTAAVDLAFARPYEEVAELLWVGAAGAGAAEAWTPAKVRLPGGLGASDRLRWAVLATGAADPLRSDLRPGAVHAAARRVIATMVSLVPAAAGSSDGRAAAPLELDDGRVLGDCLAARLAVRLSDRPDRALVRAVNAALVLLADHELALSTLAVRVAASARAELCDALLAGLGVVAGPRHGGASVLVHRLLVDADRSGVDRALNDALRWQQQLPGFGHAVYRGEDPRAAVLLQAVDEVATGPQRALLRKVRARAVDRSRPGPNIDFALGALSMAAGMPEDAGLSIFTIARVAGWTAHYLEELDEPPLRYRARAVYAART